ncbi:hypothetical protein L1887_20831 [Cichorium endivia]|nr:hypothetical protein L1887_20831 [Cichorium endivia]
MKENESIESRIQQAMRSRVQHFRDLADSLTFEGVRRLLEKDLSLDTHALDKHKKYVKQLLEKLLSDTEADDNVSKSSKQIKSEKVKKEDEEQKVTEDDDEGKIDDSPVMGLLSGKKSAKTKENSKDKIPTEDMIKEAIWKKATYFQSKSEELTVASVRRLIEEDLELEKFSLDPFKKLISKQLDEVLNSQIDTPSKTGSKSDADSSNSENEEIEVKPKKKLAPKSKVQKSEAPKKRKKPAQETEQPKKKKIKNEETSVKKKKVQYADEDSEKSDDSAEKSEKKEVVAPVYGKKVERLKSIIKACGMIVAPTVYRKAKQAPEDKREAILVKELKEILSKEGLSANPSEKEIKEVKRRKERAKELEGIDTSNIVMGSRRRSTFNFVAPPKPKAPIESDGDESEESDNDDSEDSDNEDGEDQEDDDKDGDGDGDDDKDGDDNKDGNDDDDADADADDKDGDDDHDGDDKDEDDKVNESKSEEVTGNDEIV